MNDIKPIETDYKGYKFRSRLEAKWAVFFDKIRIPWQYEPDGYDLGDLGWYLPDFYLPWFKAFIEIKPDNLDLISITKAKDKLIRLFESVDCVTMLCIGDPANDKMSIFCNDVNDSSGGGPNEWEVKFLEGVKIWDENGSWETTKHYICIAVGPEVDRERGFYTSRWNCASLLPRSSIISSRSDFHHEKVFARQARFEHGETPQI